MVAYHGAPESPLQVPDLPMLVAIIVFDSEAGWGDWRPKLCAFKVVL